MTCTVTTRVWHNGDAVTTDVALDALHDHVCADTDLFWVDLLHPDEDTMDRLAHELHLERHAVEDAMTEHERPKAVRYRTHLFVTLFAVLGVTGSDLDTSRVSAFVLPHGLVTVRLDDSFDLSPVTDRWEDNPELLRFGPLALAHGMLDEIVDEAFRVIETLDERVEEVEDQLFDDTSSVEHRFQREIYEIRRALTHLRRAVLPMRELVTTVRRRVVDYGEHDPLVPYYEDLYDHVMRAADWLDGMRDNLAGIFETNLSLADARMNAIMKKLTSWAAIIAVPTAITGWYGQNLPFPGFGEEWGFLASAAVIVGAGVILYVMFKRRDWL